MESSKILKNNPQYFTYNLNQLGVEKIKEKMYLFYR